MVRQHRTGQFKPLCQVANESSANNALITNFTSSQEIYKVNFRRFVGFNAVKRTKRA